MQRNHTYDEGTFVEELEEKYVHLHKRYFRRKDLEQFLRWAAKKARNSDMRFDRMRELIVAAFKSARTEILKGPVIWTGADPAGIEFCADMTMQVDAREIEVSIHV